jgi:hypothetical protein
LLEETLFRFAIGGVVVAAFATLGDLFKPKSFAGLFGAAPSVALATLGMVVATNGRLYAATEARSMMGGAVALLVYTLSVSWILMRRERGALVATTALIPLWLVTALAVWLIFLR